jgi:hypothetical protein
VGEAWNLFEHGEKAVIPGQISTAQSLTHSDSNEIWVY